MRCCLHRDASALADCTRSPPSNEHEAGNADSIWGPVKYLHDRTVFIDRVHGRYDNAAASSQDTYMRSSCLLTEHADLKIATVARQQPALVHACTF